MTGSLDHLLRIGRIGGMELRNRIVHAPMSLGLGQGDGTCGDRFVAYYARRAKGGAGLVNIGTVSIGYPEGSVDAKQIAASDEKFLPSLKQLANEIHAEGAKIVLQLNHNGLQAGGDRAAGRPLATPSLPQIRRGDLADCFLPDELAALSAGNPVLGEVQYQVLDHAGIRRIIAMFAAAAERAKRAGIDGVELHAGHGYLLASFLSPAVNRRTDEYGGPVENRARFLVEALQAVRQAVGPDFPVWCKLDSEEFGLEGGIRIEDAVATARLAEAAGADAISVSAYSDVSRSVTHSGSHTPQQPELLVPNAKRIKQAVSVPVITAGRIGVEDADAHIAAGHFDFVAFGRKLLADPDLPHKLHRSAADQVRPCIYCYSCISQAYFRRPILCTVNPEMGREAFAPSASRSPEPARGTTHKRVVVVGGGPVGMEAACRLRARGYTPILIERTAHLGGAFRAAATLYAPNADYLAWLEREVVEAVQDVRLEIEATPELVISLGPDVVIVATGARPVMPDIPGIHRPNVVRVEPFLEKFRGANAPSMAETIVIIGGGFAGLELAQWLVDRTGRVDVVDSAPKLGAGLPIVRRARALAELRESGVGLNAGARDIAIDDGCVTWTDMAGAFQRVAAEQVIIATPPVPDRALAEKLTTVGLTVYTVGDGDGPRTLEQTIREVADLVDSI